MVSTKKVYFAILSVVVLCFVSIGLLVSNSFKKQPLSTSAEPSVFYDPNKVLEASSTGSHISESTSTNPVLDTTQAKLEINFKAGNEVYQVFVPKGSNVYDAMIELSLSSIKHFIFKSENYPSLGYFVKSINDIKNADGYYWTLYINDKYSNLGASGYILKDGDRVEWKYENNPQ